MLNCLTALLHSGRYLAINNPYHSIFYIQSQFWDQNWHCVPSLYSWLPFNPEMGGGGAGKLCRDMKLRVAHNVAWRYVRHALYARQSRRTGSYRLCRDRLFIFTAGLVNILNSFPGIQKAAYFFWIEYIFTLIKKNYVWGKGGGGGSEWGFSRVHDIIFHVLQYFLYITCS